MNERAAALSLSLYKKLYMARRAEQYIISNYPDDEMKTPMHMSMGQEAIPVGICQALDPEDQIWTSYRSHAAFLAKTGDTDSFFAELYGKVTGTAGGKAGSMHLADPDKGFMAASAIVASSLAPAVGLAFANKSKGNGRISCVFFGDGALDEGVFWESLNTASAMQLPVLFVCEDNGFAVHTPSRVRQGYGSIVEIVKNFDCTILHDESNDVEQIPAIATEAIEAIHTTGKPAFLHIECYRYLEHVGISEDFDAGYRPTEEYERWKAKDCLEMQRQRLLRTSFSEERIQDIESEIDDSLQESIRKAIAAPFPAPEHLYQGVFHEED